MQDNLWLELGELTQRLDEAIKDMRLTGQQLARAERDYKIELRKVCLSLKLEGMAVGMIQLVAKGVESVAKKREARDVADVFYQAAREAVMSYKLQMRIVDAQLSRDYSSPSLGRGSM